MAAGMPVVRKRENKCARQSFAKRDLDVAAEDLRLGVLPLAHRVHAKLGQHERLVTRDVLQAVEIICKWSWLVEIDVEADKIEARGLEKFCRRKIDERNKPVRVDAFDNRRKFV